MVRLSEKAGAVKKRKVFDDQSFKETTGTFTRQHIEAMYDFLPLDEWTIRERALGKSSESARLSFKDA
mgnify:CR=1 FL=1